MRRIVSTLSVLIAGVCSVAGLYAQEQPAEDVEAASLPLRTALYHDPTLTPPLERLVQLYQRAGRMSELVGLYRQHVAQYPADTGALTVLIRLLAATNDPEAGRLVRSAADQHPDNAFFQFLLFEHLRKTREPGALDALDRAITKEQQLARKRSWIEQLLPIATAEGRPELVKRHLEALAASARTAEEKLEVARQMISQKLHEPAISVLGSAASLTPSAETGVEIELAASSAELGVGSSEAAGVRLDRLLGRLAADYWRRSEILHRRIALVKTDSERESMVSAARARWKAAPDNDNAALELSQLLAAFEFRREALTVLLEASKRVPASEKLEKAALDLFDLLRDEHGREAFLAERLRLAPDRSDLALARSRSLFVLGRREEALEVFDNFAAKLDPSTRLTQLLEGARFLRRSTLHADAAELFRRAVEQAPNRMDVRRELAETWLALGQKQKVRDVFSGALPDDVEIEGLLDVVQFFLKEGMLAEAREAIARRVARDPQNFDLRLMQLTVAGRLADQMGGRQLISEILPLVDTDARYRRWLEAAVTFHETFESEGEFLASEQARLMSAPEGWTRENSERRLIFADFAAAHGRKAEVTAMLAEASNGEVPAEVRVELRRRRLALVENDPAQSEAAEEQLKALLQDDVARADEYRIRLALLFSRNKRHDQIGQILGLGGTRDALANVDLQKIGDAALLAGLEGMLREFGGNSKLHSDILDRLTTLEPGNRGAWERWITALATSGKEEQLRVTLQRILAGIERLSLSAETRDLLQRHLLASHWRSISASLKVGDEVDRKSELLPLIESAARLAKTRNEWLWTAWARAFTLNRLGRHAARDEAIRELERVVSQPLEADPSPSEENTENKVSAETMVTFPDGLGISLSEARSLLTASPKKQTVAIPTRSGPNGDLQVRWAFDTDRRTPLLKVIPLEGGRVLVLDAEGRLYCLESSTGKVIWSRDGAKPIRTQRDERYGYSGRQNAVIPPPVPVYEKERIFVAMSDGVECWSAKSGELLWRAPNIHAASQSHSAFPTLFVHEGRVLVCEPSASAVSSLDAETGKTEWQRTYASKATVPPSPNNSGASFSDGRILLYGQGTWVISATSGDILWSFEADKVEEFPIALTETPPVTNAPVPANFAYGVRSGFYRGGMYSGRNNFLAIDYLQSARYGGMWFSQPGARVALVNPVAAWTAAAAHDGQSRFAAMFGERLVLFSSSNVYSLRLDVPFGGSPANSNGTFVGISGRSFCVLSGNVLITVDSESGQNTTIPLVARKDPSDDGDDDTAIVYDEAAARRSAEEYDAVLDGVVVYVSDRQGVTGYHTRTGQRISGAAWPASIVPKEAPATEQNGSVYYVPQGIMRSNQYGQGHLQPLTAAVGNGMLYVRSEGSRLVALAGDEAGKETNQ